MAGASEQIPKAVEGGSLLATCKSGGKTPVKRLDPFMVFRSDLPGGGRFTGVLDVAIIQNGYKFYRELESGNDVEIFNKASLTKIGNAVNNGKFESWRSNAR